MRAGRVVAAATLLGFVAGVAWAQGSMHHSRRALFSQRPLRRLAALGYLSGQPGVETIQVLRDYLAWESHPTLRRRADAIVRRLEAALA